MGFLSIRIFGGEIAVVEYQEGGRLQGGQGMTMVGNDEYVAIFNSIHRVMKAEKVLKGLSLPIMLIPAPRTLASDCGLAIRYAAADREAVEEALATADLSPEEIYVKEGESYLRVPDVPEA
jgi:hypothetical protein